MIFPGISFVNLSYWFVLLCFHCVLLFCSVCKFALLLESLPVVCFSLTNFRFVWDFAQMFVLFVSMSRHLVLFLSLPFRSVLFASLPCVILSQFSLVFSTFHECTPVFHL